MLPNAKQVVNRKSRLTPTQPDVPDLHSQLEELLDEVWKREAEWRFDDRIDLALHRKR